MDGNLSGEPSGSRASSRRQEALHLQRVRVQLLGQGRPVCRSHSSNASFPLQSHLKIHMRRHTGVRPYRCDVAGCERTFADRSTQSRHMAMVHKRGKEEGEDKKKFTCEICKHSYCDRSTFKRHLRERHPPSTASTATAPPASSSSPSSKKAKKANVTSNPPKEFACRLCPKSFNRRVTALQHARRVHGRINDGEDRSSILRRRKDASSPADDVKSTPLAEEENGGGKEGVSWSGGVKCPDCDMIFLKRSAMVVHRRTHTGDKPYVCETCGKKFARGNNLKLHRRVHTGERPYKCTADPESCQRAFADISAYRRHLRTHTGEKPYGCPRCLKRFSQMGTLRSHGKHCKGVPPPTQPPASEAAVVAKPEASLTPNAVESSSAPTTLEGADNSLSVMAGSEPPVFNTDTLDSVRVACLS